MTNFKSWLESMKPSRQDFHLNLPSDEDIAKQVSDREASFHADREKHPDRYTWMTPELLANYKSGWEKQERDWSAEVQQAYTTTIKVCDYIKAKLNCHVEPAGSFAKGTFHKKGKREYDLDVHVSGLNLPETPDDALIVNLPENIKKVFSQAAKITKTQTKTVLDIFVTHSNRLWVVTSKLQLSRKPGLFGKEVRQTSQGVRVQTGEDLSWDELQKRFWNDLGTYDRL